MGSYRVEILPKAARALRDVHHQVRARLRGAMQKLSEDPRPPGAKALVARSGLPRVTVGDYRILYTVQDDVLTVVVVQLGHRGQI